MMAATALLARNGTPEVRKLPSIAAMLCLMPRCLGREGGPCEGSYKRLAATTGAEQRATR
jgi:hypothetical protein